MGKEEISFLPIKDRDNNRKYNTKRRGENKETYMRNWKTSFLLMNGQCGSEAPGKDPSEGGQPQESTDSNFDSNSVPRFTCLD